jgi:hypothetical protein
VPVMGHRGSRQFWETGLARKFPFEFHALASGPYELSPVGPALRQIPDVMKAAGWQPHSVRLYLSGTVGKKLGLKVESTKAENGERRYSIKG